MERGYQRIWARITLIAKSWASILAIVVLVALLGQLSRQTHFGTIVLVCINFFRIGVIFAHDIGRARREELCEEEVAPRSDGQVYELYD